MAIALLLAGGLAALQTGAILTAIPVSIVMVGMCIATYKAFHSEHQVLITAERRARRDESAQRIEQRVAQQLSENFDDHFGEQVDARVEAAIAEQDKLR